MEQQINGKKQMKGQYAAFLLALGMAFVMFLPFVIYDQGYFFFFGDFNVQQIPFYQLAHEAVRSGDVFWNWYTDLGANFIASYSFYLLFSPFFYLTLLFPTSFVPYLMAPLLVLKIACMAFTSYLFISRFTKNRNYAIVGALLYAFSGFSIYNIFFNHFHEAMVFFPLLLVALEELVQNNRKGLFAAAVALNCVVNYWFFIGEVVFVIIYVFIRMTDKTWGMNFKKFCIVAFESVVGLLISMAVLLPSVMILLGNPRTTSDNLLSGWNFWIYWEDQRPLAILQSIFFPPDLPSRPNFFPDNGAKWASLSAWLPLFSAGGVIAYLFGSHKSWIKKLLLTCLVIALVPGLNSMFILFNHSYYARWFYMPVLIMALATVLALENKKIDFMRGMRWCGGIIFAFIIMIGLTPNKKNDEWQIGMMAEPARFWLTCLIALICLLLACYAYNQLCKDEKKGMRKLIALLCVMSVVHGIYFITNGKMHSNDTDFLRNTALYGRENIPLPDDSEFARIDLYKQMDNLGMYWHQPNIQAFHSVVPNSIMEFYPKVGVKRDVSSKPETSNYALRPLLSVKYFITTAGQEGAEDLMPGFVYDSSQHGFDFYLNENFLPMGFGYTEAFDQITLNQIPESMRANFMLSALHLEDEAIERNSDILTKTMEPDFSFGDPAITMVDDVQNRRALACYEFEIDNMGFSAKSNTAEDCMMFFSVPYESGWSATVNGKPVVVEKANIGFMAVRVPAGQAEIRFNYMTPGLLPGLAATGTGLLVLIVYLVISKSIARRKKISQLSELTAQNFHDFIIAEEEQQGETEQTDIISTTPPAEVEQPEEEQTLTAPDIEHYAEFGAGYQSTKEQGMPELQEEEIVQDIVKADDEQGYEHEKKAEN